ncbi:MAG: signal peptidase I [Cellulosilyticaceae bacterium]
MQNVKQEGKHEKRIGNKSKHALRWCELLKEILMAVLVVMMFTQFVGSHSVVPTGSMIPTIEIGDHLITNKIPYYYRDPQRGEVVVFGHEGEYLVKRVVGMPGDEIDIRDNKVWVNGHPLDESNYIYIWDSTWQVVGVGMDYPLTIPEDHYFMLGDNRPDSLDSRYFGPISRAQVVSKAMWCIFPISKIGVIK